MLKINQQPVSWPDLKMQLSDIFKTRAEKVAFVQDDDEVNFEYVAYVIDTAREARGGAGGLAAKGDGDGPLRCLCRETALRFHPPAQYNYRDCSNRSWEAVSWRISRSACGRVFGGRHSWPHWVRKL